MLTYCTLIFNIDFSLSKPVVQYMIAIYNCMCMCAPVHVGVDACMQLRQFSG